MSIMTTFENITANPGYSKEDGIDVVNCDNDKCCYRDTETSACLFETCIIKTVPYDIPFHSTFTHNCKICEESYGINTAENNPLTSHLEYEICGKCLNGLRSLLK